MNAWLILFGYCVGAIPFALLLSRRADGTDVRYGGSGNVGAANVFRTTSISVALMVIVLDISKGCMTALLAVGVHSNDVTVAATGMAAVAGHVYPLWLKFQGGKGVATACGVFSVLTPVATAIAVATFVGVVWFSRYVSMGSIVASLLLPVVAYLSEAPQPFVICSIGGSALILYRHWGNVVRLCAGTERRLGQQV